MITSIIYALSILTPVQKAYMVATILHNSLGIFECLVIWRTKFAPVNTVVFYLTSAIVAMIQLLVELHVKNSGPYFMVLFACVFVANCIYMTICLIRTRDKHPVWVMLTFLIMFTGICHAVHGNAFAVRDRGEFLRVLMFTAIMVNNFVPFDSMLALLSLRQRQCPPQWIPLITGLMQSMFGGLYRHQAHEYLLAPADALGVAVHLFGLVVELSSLFATNTK